MPVIPEVREDSKLLASLRPEDCDICVFTPSNESILQFLAEMVRDGHSMSHATLPIIDEYALGPTDAEIELARSIVSPCACFISYDTEVSLGDFLPVGSMHMVAPSLVEKVWVSDYERIPDGSARNARQYFHPEPLQLFPDWAQDLVYRANISVRKEVRSRRGLGTDMLAKASNRIARKLLTNGINPFFFEYTQNPHMVGAAQKAGYDTLSPNQVRLIDLQALGRTYYMPSGYRSITLSHEHPTEPQKKRNDIRLFYIDGEVAYIILPECKYPLQDTFGTFPTGQTLILVNPNYGREEIVNSFKLASFYFGITTQWVSVVQIDPRRTEPFRDPELTDGNVIFTGGYAPEGNTANQR